MLLGSSSTTVNTPWLVPAIFALGPPGQQIIIFVILLLESDISTPSGGTVRTDSLVSAAADLLLKCKREKQMLLILF